MRNDEINKAVKEAHEKIAEDAHVIAVMLPVKEHGNDLALLKLSGQRCTATRKTRRSASGKTSKNGVRNGGGNMENKKGIAATDILVIALAVLFIALKLCGVITWSWIWVLAPLWLCALAAGVVLLGILVYIVKKRRRRHG